MHYAERSRATRRSGTRPHTQRRGAVGPAPARPAIRSIALELERLANTGDLSLAGDVGFLPPPLLRPPRATLTSRRSSAARDSAAVWFDRRHGLRPQARPRRDDITTWRPSRRRQHRRTPLDHRLRQARFEKPASSPQDRRNLGVGPAARACGIDRDTRVNFPAGIWQFTQIPVSTWHTGDVFARAWVRWLEIQRSVDFLRDQLKALPAGPVMSTPAGPRPEQFAVSLVEGWRGEIVHVAATGADGKFAFYKVVDPSFHNWSGLALSLRDQQISDFPLCNKSFNLSYCGFDL